MVVVKYSSIGGKGVIVDAQENMDEGTKLINAIDLQTIDTDLYMSKELWIPFGARGAYGGQVVAQALYAGFQTVPENFFVHSLHCYFILTSSNEIPIIYKVDRVRDGRSYATRTITASQRGKAVFVCSCSFSKSDNHIHLEHQKEMPDVMDAESLPSAIEMIEAKIQLPEIPDKVKERLTMFKEIAVTTMSEEMPVEYREIDDYTTEEIVTGKLRPKQADKRWFKARGNLGDDPRLHACALAYASDFELLQTAAKANGVTYRSGSIGMISSLDHSMWFHGDARADEWLLHDMHSPRTNDGRGVSFGKIYTRDGLLVATTAQEGVIRLADREQERRKKQAQAANEMKTKHGENNRL